MKTRLMIALALAGATSGAWASSASLIDKTLPAVSAGDRSVSAVVSAPLPPGQFERAPVQFAWALDPGQPVAAPQVEVMESRSFWRTVEAAELQRGLELELSAPGAVIQLSPAPGARPLPAQSLHVRDAGNRVLPTRAFDTAQLQQAGMPVAAGTAMVKLEAGDMGRYRVQADDAQGRYVLQVLEPDSPVVLRTRTDRAVAFAGTRLGLQVDMDGLQTAPASLAGKLGSGRLMGQGLLVAPDGRTWDVPLQASRSGGLSASVPVPAEGSEAPGLWELQVFTEQAGIARDSRVAFAVSRPTARLAGAVRASSHADVRFPLQVGAPGRYEVRATLFATGTDGALRPVAQGHSAAWFNGPGRGELGLSFADVALPAGYGAPFELREVEVHDQTRLAPIERRARALRF
jgi:hypothetical protein